MLKRHIFYLLFLTVMLSFVGCIDDSFTTSPSDQPTFSVDTLDMGVVFTDEQTATHRFTVYNRNPKGLNISDISLSGENSDLFRLNVDGMSGKTFKDIEVRANDSIFVFVCADLNANGSATPMGVNTDLNFMVNGVLSMVVISVKGQDIKRIKGETLTSDTRFSGKVPYQITDSLVVDEGVTLTLDPGTTLLFHDNAKLIVKGTILAIGTSEDPIKITGDRMGDVIPDVSFDLMSRQWYGMEIMPSSRDNYMAYTELSNTSYGLTVYGDGQDVDDKKLTLVNCRLRNSGDCILSAIGASVGAYGCEFAEAANSLVYLVGGNHRFDQCTAANYYLFSAISGAAWTIPDFTAWDQYMDFLPTKAEITNTITYGLGPDASPGDFTGREVYFIRCLFKSQGEDDYNFIETIWGEDPLFYTVRSEYLFDYRVKPDSPAIMSAYTFLSEYPLETDFYGEKRVGDLGAYVYVEPEEDFLAY